MKKYNLTYPLTVFALIFLVSIHADKIINHEESIPTLNGKGYIEVNSLNQEMSPLVIIPDNFIASIETASPFVAKNDEAITTKHLENSPIKTIIISSF